MLQLTRAYTPGRIAVVCIPGTFCSPEIFDLVDEKSQPGVQILPVSWMTSPGPWDIPTLSRRVSLLLQEMRSDPIVLVGHSTGGIIALAALLNDAAPVNGLLLADTGANTQGHGDMTAIISVIEKGVGPAFFQQLLRRSFYHQPEAHLIERLVTYASNVPPEAALQALTSQATLDLADRLAEITVPTMVVHGRYDQARPQAHAELLAASLPNAELHLLDTGHTPMVEAIPEYMQILRQLCVMISHDK